MKKGMLEQVVARPTQTILEVLGRIDVSGQQIALVVDEAQMLMGVVTDGDVRRAILRGVSLHRPVEEIMNRSPKLARPGESVEGMLAVMRRFGLRHLPQVDGQGRLLGLLLRDELLGTETRSNPVVLMAGGLGVRLRPLTEDIPKPMLRVGTKPILETILDSLIQAGFSEFHISVNYKAEIIRDHFKDGERWGVSIQYIEEKTRLGTAGALALFQDSRVPQEPVIVMNADLLTRLNFHQLLDFHQAQQSVATMCAREYTHQVPYGVIVAQDGEIKRIEEKPIQRHQVNAGIYALSPAALAEIPRGQAYDMPALFDALRVSGQRTCAYAMQEYWLDIGQMSDFERANSEYEEVFS
jgi:dTDP-glucose pyrophosphorylase